MNRASFLKRMAFAALACGFLEVPRFEVEEDVTVWLVTETDGAVTKVRLEDPDALTDLLRCGVNVEFRTTLSRFQA